MIVVLVLTKLVILQVKRAIILLDDHALPVDNGEIVFRRAPGNCHYTFGQVVPLVIGRSDSRMSLKQTELQSTNSGLHDISPRGKLKIIY